MNSTFDLDRVGLCELRTSLIEGRALNLIETALLRTFLNDHDKAEENIFKCIKNRSKLGTLKDDPIIKDVLDIIDHRLNRDTTVIQLRSKKPRTILYGECINAIIQGASGESYEVEVITDVESIITNQQEVLNIQEKMKQKYPDLPINGLQCIMDTNNTDLIHSVISTTLASDKYKAEYNFSSTQEFIDSIDTDTGFVVRVNDYTVVVYSRGEDMVVRTTTSTNKNFVDADPTIFDLLLR